MTTNDAFVLGIDFGTSTTLIAIPGEPPQVLVIGETERWIPSVLASSDGQTWAIGENADASDVRSQIRSPKSFITHDHFGLISNDLGFEIEADEAVAKILRVVKERCKDLGISTRSPIRMSCPAIWDGNQRKRLARIATEVGFNVDVDHIMDEPIAAAVAWWWHKQNSGEKLQGNHKALIFDLGGGTLDVAVVDVYSTDDHPEITVLAARGTKIAGDKLDEDFARHIEARLLHEEGFEFRGGAHESEIAAWIRRYARLAKESLSTKREHRFEPQIPGLDIPSLQLTRMELEAVFAPLMSVFESCVRATLREAKLKQSSADISVIMQEDIQAIGDEVDFVVLAGGMSRIPYIETKLAEIMTKAHIGFVSTAENSTSSIVEGVANLGEFAGLNVHRPSFDLVIKWQTPQMVNREECIYRAFQPLYSDDQLNRREGLLGMDLDFAPGSDANNGFHLEIQTVGGKEVSFTLDGVRSTSIVLSAGRNSKVKIKLYMDGKLYIRDDLGRDRKMRIREWPVLRWGSTGRKMQPLRMETESIDFSNSKTNHWDLNLD